MYWQKDRVAEVNLISLEFAAKRSTTYLQISSPGYKIIIALFDLA